MFDVRHFVLASVNKTRNTKIHKTTSPIVSNSVRTVRDTHRYRVKKFNADLTLRILTATSIMKSSDSKMNSDNKNQGRTLKSKSCYWALRNT